MTPKKDLFEVSTKLTAMEAQIYPENINIEFLDGHEYNSKKQFGVTP